MIGGHERELATCERLPQGHGLTTGTERRRTLGHRAEALGVLLGQHQVVGSHFTGDVDLTRAGLGDQGHRPAG